MAAMKISVPTPIEAWVQSRVESGAYASPSDYMGELIRRDQEDTLDREAIIAALEVGEASGISARSALDILADLKAKMAPPTR